MRGFVGGVGQSLAWMTLGSVGPQNFGVSGMGKENGMRKCLAI